MKEVLFPFVLPLKAREKEKEKKERIEKREKYTKEREFGDGNNLNGGIETYYATSM